MTAPRRRTGITVEIDRLSLALPVLPGVTPDRVIAGVEAGLARLRLDRRGAGEGLPSLTLPPIRARRGESADGLARRIVAAIEGAIASGEVSR